MALNAGAALYAADVASSLREGVAMARETLASGGAADRVQLLRELTA